MPPDVAVAPIADWAAGQAMQLYLDSRCPTCHSVPDTKTLWLSVQPVLLAAA